MDKNKEFARLAGICWHEPQSESWKCKCGVDYGTSPACMKHCEVSNPDFSDPREVLKVMMDIDKDDSFERFIVQSGVGVIANTLNGTVHCIDTHYITTPGLLRDKACEWLKEVNNEKA